MTTASDIELFLKILFRRKSIKMLKLERPLFFNFYKKYLEFSLLFVLLIFASIISVSKKLFYCFILVSLNMTSQKHKEKQKQKLLQKASQNCLAIKLFLREMNHLLVLTPTYLICKMIYRFHLKLSSLK